MGNNSSNNNSGKQTEMDTVAVSRELRAASQATVLSKPEDKTAATAEHAQKDAARSQEQTTALAASVALENGSAAAATVTQSTSVTQRLPKKSRHERASDTIQKYLAVIKESPIGSADTVDAWSKIIDTISRYPKKNVLDSVYAFFTENKDEDFLHEMNALANTAMLEKSVNIRVRLLYEIFHGLAHGRATRRTISLDTVRTIFGSDDLVNWIATKLPRTNR